MRKGTRPPRAYLWMFIGVFVLAETLLIVLDLYYLFARGDTVADFLFDFSIITVIILGLIALTYFMLRRTLIGYIDSERRFHELADLLPEGLVEIGADGKVTYANDLALEWFGYAPADVEAGSINVFDIVAEGDRARARANMLAILSGEALTPSTYLTTKQDGTFLPLLISSSTIVHSGQAVGLRVVLTDVSVQVQAAEQVRESEAKYRGLFESSLDGILVVGLSTMMITDANQAFLEMIGYPLEELREKVYSDLTPRRWHKMETAIIRDQVLERDFSDEYEKEITRKDGTEVPVSVRRWLIKDESGTPIGMWSILRDITEKKRREEDIEKANAELIRYAQTVSHDLKGPIHEATMAGDTAQMLIGLPQDEQVAGYLTETFEVLRHGLTRANTLIDDMLVLAETGQKPPEVEAVSISETVAEVLAERSSDLELRNIQVLQDEDMGVLMASATHVYQIFSNLIKNAIIHGDTMRPVIEIRSLGGVEPGEHRLLVRDNGAGIPENLLESIFFPFARGVSGDTGIGLSIVQRLTEVYGGSVRAYNDSGACFEVVLHDYPPA
ncbi:MAG: PAS domain S-box protein [Candidatus Geothermincolia bacterium]